MGGWHGCLTSGVYGGMGAHPRAERLRMMYWQDPCWTCYTRSWPCACERGLARPKLAWTMHKSKIHVKQASEDAVCKSFAYRLEVQADGEDITDLEAWAYQSASQ